MAENSRRARDTDVPSWHASDTSGTRALRGEFSAAGFLPAPTRPPFLLRELLTECATSSAAPLWSGPLGPGPMSFVSDVLGTAVPVSCVLNLAGALAGAGRDAQLTLETLDPGRRAVIVHERRRFSLALVCAGLDELCRRPGCDCPAPHPHIAFCEEHLAGCGADTLTALARRWGLAQNPDDRPGHREGSPEAELIVRAAAAAGACDRVIGALVDALFPRPEHDEAASRSQERERALRGAHERERHRLTEIGRAEAHRIRQTAEECATCGNTPGPYTEASIPPRCRSASCALPERRTLP